MIWSALLLFLLVGWLLLCLGFYMFQHALMYRPDQHIPDMKRASVYPGHLVHLRSKDDASLRTTNWYWPSNVGKPTILFLHGNNGTIESRTAWMQFALTTGWGLMMVGYRGYGGNPGRPTQAGLVADSLRAYDFLIENQAISPKNIGVLGHSLGAAVAVQLAIKQPIGALGLISPFTSAHHMAFDSLPILPWQLILRDQWRSIDLIADVLCPIAIVACDRDKTVPFKRSQQLFNAAPEPKEFLNIPGLDHDSIALSGAPQALVDFFDRVMHNV